MKKVLLFLVLLISSLMPMYAQDTIILNVTDVHDVDVCAGSIVAIYAQQNCNEWLWKIDNVNQGMVNPIILQSQIEKHFRVQYFGCDFVNDFGVWYYEPWAPTSFTHDVWKRSGETITIEPVGSDSLILYSYLWSTGATTSTISVSEPGTYTCEISDGLCGTGVRTFIVQDNVEIYRSGVDPVTNKNRVLWQTTPEQSAYISNVKIERDGMVVGTVPYLDGQFLDNIGSENAARIYSITGIASDGTECPIPSYQFGTFNTIYSPDIANPSLMNFSWEDPFIEEGSPYEVVAYRIGRLNESGEFIVIDQLSSNVHLGKYDMDLFNGDYGVVAAVFNDSKRDYEELAFSNCSDNGILGVGELSEGAFKVFPNPSNGTFTVEGVSSLTIYNTLGQVVATSRSENGKHTLSLATGVYFLKSDEGAVRRIVVE